MTALAARFRQDLLAVGLANQHRGQFPEAEKCYRLVLNESPMDPEALYRMGILALQCANASGAVHFLTQAAKMRLFDADGHYNLGMAHVLDYAFDQAQVEFERALELDAAHPSAAIGLGNVHKFMGRPQQAANAYLAAIASKRLDAVLFSQILVGLHTVPAIDPAMLFDLHCEWGRRYAEPFYPDVVGFPNVIDPERRLRIGLVSPNLTANIVGHFLLAVLPPFARYADVYVYDARNQEDWLTEEIKRSAIAWRNIATVDDVTAAALIANDRIDVLLDLAGHTPGHRLQLLARRPAPVQATWLDYFDTTGVRTIDLIVTDVVTTPRAMVDSGAQRFVETVARLPHSRLCYAPPPYVPDVAPAPSIARGQVTFGCFGRADKMVPEVLALWSRVLDAVPSSRMILKSTGFDITPVRERIFAEFEAHGIERGRVEFRSSSPHIAMLAEYADVDIALDSFPYNGGATTCDALLMGVPVVTLAGSSMISRQGASLLHAARCPEWVAQDHEMFVAIATELASQRTHGSHRAELRARLLASPLCDGEGFARDLAGILHAAWRRWCSSTERATTRPSVSCGSERAP